MRQILTTTKIRALAKKSESSMTSDGGGLYFRKRKNSASWIIRRTRNKVAGFTTIGRYPDMSLAAARKALEQFGDHSAENMTVKELPWATGTTRTSEVGGAQSRWKAMFDASPKKTLIW